jgi:hypothetical protein
MSEKPSIDIRRFQPNKISSKYWIKFLLYALILGTLTFWYKKRSNKKHKVNNQVEQTQLNLEGFTIQE